MTVTYQRPQPPPGPLSRLPQEQPRLDGSEFVPDLPVSGRSQPRPEPLPVDFRHDVRFHGAAGGLGVSVYCQPCHWGCWIDDGHTLPDLIRLVAQHAGIPDTTATTTEALMALLKPLVTL